MSGTPEAWTSFALLAAVTIVAAVCDIRTGLVFNWLNYSAIVAGIVLHAAFGAIEGGLAGAAAHGGAALLVGTVAFLAGLVVFGLSGLGGGDIKLIAAIGAITASFDTLLWACFYGLIFTFLGALVMMVYTGQTKLVLMRIVAAALSGKPPLRKPHASVAKDQTDLALPAADGEKAAPNAGKNSTGTRFPVAVTLAIGALLAAAEYQVHLLKLPWTWPVAG